MSDEITYSEVITVRLGGKIVGTIKPKEGGWQYTPKHQKRGGIIFWTLSALKADIEGREE